jgi:hypothetical protein
VIRHAPPKSPRPTTGATRAAPVVPAARPFEPLKLETHRDLARRQAEIAARLAAEPQLAVMMAINPVLALEALGVTMTPEIAHHVLHTLQHPAEVRSRRDELEQALRQALGEPARPNEPAWNAHLLFDLRRLAPLDTQGRSPAYTAPLGQEESRPLQAMRPPATPERYPYPHRLPARSRVSSVPWKESLRRLDLDAPVPSLPAATVAPKDVPLEDLWFYKDLDPVVHDALELGFIRKIAFPIHGPDRFRRILEGKEANAFLLWIHRIAFRAEPRR